MNKIKIITQPQELCIGQLYMYEKYNGLERGICIRIFQDKVSFERKGGYVDDVRYRKYLSDDGEFTYIAEYNARVFNRYNKLIKQHKKELKECLNGKPVYVEEISKKKWYERFLRRKRK